MIGRPAAALCVLAGALIAPAWTATAGAVPPADSLAPPRLALPWTVGLQTDGDRVRFGLGGMLRWRPLGDGGVAPGEIAGRHPLGLDLQMSSVQESGDLTGGQGLHGALRATFDVSGCEGWLGVASGDSRGEALERARVHGGGGLTFRTRRIAVETALIGSRVSPPPGIVRPVFHATGRLGGDSIYFGDAVVGSERNTLWTTGVTTLSWRIGRAEAGVIAGLTVGGFTRPQRWAQADLRVRVVPAVTLALAAGQRAPSVLAFDPNAAPRTMLGLEVRPVLRLPAPAGASSEPAPEPPPGMVWRSVPLGRGRFAVRVMCRYASRLELRGDFTEWEPVVMRRAGADWWEVVAVMEPGLRALQVRVNGGDWVAPPGLPLNAAAADRPSGTLLVP